jgi:hypothetical protein
MPSVSLQDLLRACNLYQQRKLVLSLEEYSLIVGWAASILPRRAATSIQFYEFGFKSSVVHVPLAHAVCVSFVG